MSEKQIEPKSTVDSQKAASPDEQTFGGYLRSIRKSRNLSVRAMAKQLNRTPTYLSDIENGYNRPPDHELLDSMIEILGLPPQTYAASRLYDLAAKERGDIPFDVKKLLYEKPVIIPLLRYVKHAPDGEALLEQAELQLRSACQ